MDTTKSLFMKSLFTLLFIFSLTLNNYAEDYLILKNGRKIIGKITIENLQYYEFHKPKIESNGKSYKSPSVASFECDGVYYANVLNQLFTPSIIRGKINAFHFKVINKKGYIETYSHDDIGIQKNEKDEVIKLTYKHLKKMISDNPALVSELEELGKPKAKITMKESVANELLMNNDNKLMEIINKYNAAK